MTLDDLLAPDRVLRNAEARSKKHALEIVSELIASAEGTPASSDVFDALVAREKLGSTALGRAVAIPHGRLVGLERCVGAFLRLAEPVDFDAPDGRPVDLICAVVVPQECGEEEPRSIARIAERLSDRRFRVVLRQASGSRELYNLLIHCAADRSASA
ncbi:MAG: PTS sugar transporter subunit IIA [Gammaproteobacteria bacterium]